MVTQVLFLLSLFLGFPAMAAKLPIIFDPAYDISFWGIEKLHPFDSKKYGKVYSYLINHAGLTAEQFYTPIKVTDADLLLVHPQSYLDALKSSATTARIAEIKIIRWMPNWLVQRKVLDPMRLATGGTILGAQLALEKGWAINLAGGYHHAKADDGGGFCFFADIPLAMYKLWQTNPHLKIMIIDLDAHQGNGYESILKDDPRVAIFDVYNEYAYPHDEAAKRFIRFNHPIVAGTDDTLYMQLLERYLPHAIDEFIPDLIIYNAGTDVLEGDTVGRLKITPAGVIARDAYVFGCARARAVPILMLLSGGYTKQSAGVIGRSIENLIHKAAAL